jgi:hypothetical protein
MRYHGGKAVIQMAVAAGGPVSAVVSMSKWSLNRTRDKVEVTCFGDLNKVYVQGLPDIKGTISGFWDSADDALYAGSNSANGVDLYLYPSSLYPSSYEYGPAWLDQTIDVDVKGAAGTWGHSH